jgi:general stress protein YciG
MWAADVFFQNYCLKTGVRRQASGDRKQGSEAARNGGAASILRAGKRTKGKDSKSYPSPGKPKALEVRPALKTMN